MDDNDKDESNGLYFVYMQQTAMCRRNSFFSRMSFGSIWIFMKIDSSIMLLCQYDLNNFERKLCVTDIHVTICGV